MVRRKVSVRESVLTRIAAIAIYINDQGLVQTALKFFDDIFDLLASLAEKCITHRPCSYPDWRKMNYRCATFRKKYSVAYLDLPNDIIVCDFAVTRYLVSRL